jgi:hypothetical protein
MDVPEELIEARFCHDLRSEQEILGGPWHGEIWRRVNRLLAEVEGETEKGRKGGRIAVRLAVSTKQVVETMKQDRWLGQLASQKWRRAVARHTGRGEKTVRANDE